MYILLTIILLSNILSSFTALVAPIISPTTTNEFTPLVITCINSVPNNVGLLQIFNPHREMVGTTSYNVPNATREFAGTYSCVAISQIDSSDTATTTAEVIIQRKIMA